MRHSRKGSIGLKFIKRFLYHNFPETAKFPYKLTGLGPDETVRNYDLSVPSSPMFPQDLHMPSPSQDCTVRTPSTFAKQ